MPTAILQDKRNGGCLPPERVLYWIFYQMSGTLWKEMPVSANAQCQALGRSVGAGLQHSGGNSRQTKRLGGQRKIELPPCQVLVEQ